MDQVYQMVAIANEYPLAFCIVISFIATSTFCLIVLKLISMLKSKKPSVDKMVNVFFGQSELLSGRSEAAYEMVERLVSGVLEERNDEREE